MKEESLGKGRGEKKGFKIPRKEPWMKAAEGQVVSQGKAGRGGGEGSRGDLREKRQCQGWQGTRGDQVLPWQELAPSMQP